MTPPVQVPPGIPDFLHTITTPTPCTADPEVWQSEAEDDSKHARRHCAPCPVRTACLTWAMDHPEETGTWGGLTRRQRLYRRGDQDTELLADDTEAPTALYCRERDLTPLQAQTLRAAWDGAPADVVAERLGVSEHKAVSRLGMLYERLGVNGLPSGERRAAAVAAARAAGLLPEVLGVAA